MTRSAMYSTPEGFYGVVNGVGPIGPDGHAVIHLWNADAKESRDAWSATLRYAGYCEYDGPFNCTLHPLQAA
jgi:hypothetical protein